MQDLAFLNNQNDSHLHEKSVQQYIKIVGFLHPDILKLVRKGNSKSNSIPLSTADILANASPNDQLLIIKEIFHLKGSKCPIIENLFSSGKYQRFDRNIRFLLPSTSQSNSNTNSYFYQHQLPTSTSIPISVPVPTYIPLPLQTNFPAPIPSSPDPHSPFIHFVNSMIQSYCSLYNCSRDFIVPRLS